MTPRERAVAWAAALAADERTCYLDTETTSLGDAAEIVDIALVDWDGRVLIDTLVKPLRPIPEDVSKIHGITDRLVEAAPSWTEVWPRVYSATIGKIVCIYNAPYDLGVIARCCARMQLIGIEFRWEDALKSYAEFDGTMTTKRFKRYGRWVSETGPKWHKLGEAAAAMGIANPGAHRALADAETTRRLVLAMAGLAVPAPTREPVGQRLLF